MNNHLRNINGSFIKNLKVKLLCHFLDSQHLWKGLNKFVNCWKNTAEIESAHNVGFFVFYLLGRNFSMCDFVMYCSHTDWIDFFVLRSHEHAGNACRVNILDFKFRFRVVIKLVKEIDSIEKSLVVTMIAAHYFNHPIDHFSP